MPLLAHTEEGLRPPVASGERGHCPHCQTEMVAKVGTIVIPHWAHIDANCGDTWSKPETLWHLKWKQLLHQHGATIEHTIKRNGQHHRADAITPHGEVIELQHSAIDTATIEEREKFYGRMAWIVDARHYDDERWHQGRYVGDDTYGLWIKNGPRTWAAFRRPVYAHRGKDHLEAFWAREKIIRNEYGDPTSTRLLGQTRRLHIRSFLEAKLWTNDTYVAPEEMTVVYDGPPLTHPDELAAIHQHRDWTAA